MDSHRISGGLKEAAGTAQEVAGRVLGDRDTERRGVARKTGGEIERRYGEILDSIRAAVRDRPLLTIAGIGALALVIGAAITREPDNV